MNTLKYVQALFVVILLIMLIGVTLATSWANEDVRVWVEYQDGYKAGVEADARRMGAQFHYDFNRLGSFVVSLPLQAAERLAQNPHVLSIEPDPERFLAGNQYKKKPVESTQEVPYGIDMVQAREIWDVDEDGKVDTAGPICSKSLAFSSR